MTVLKRVKGTSYDVTKGLKRRDGAEGVKVIFNNEHLIPIMLTSIILSVYGFTAQFYIDV